MHSLIHHQGNVAGRTAGNEEIGHVFKMYQYLTTNLVYIT